MRLSKFIVMFFTLVGILIASCANKSNSPKEVHEHIEHVVNTKKVEKNIKINRYENELGQALDTHGNLIKGCPVHKEMIGVAGDKCPKCDYMEMLPVTWSLEGIDTVRVEILTNYFPPTDKL